MSCPVIPSCLTSQLFRLSLLPLPLHDLRPSLPTAPGSGPPYGYRRNSSQPPLPGLVRPSLGLGTHLPGVHVAEPTLAKSRRSRTCAAGFSGHAPFLPAPRPSSPTLPRSVVACPTSTALQPADQGLFVVPSSHMHSMHFPMSLTKSGIAQSLQSTAMPFPKSTTALAQTLKRMSAIS